MPLFILVVNVSTNGSSESFYVNFLCKALQPGHKLTLFREIHWEMGPRDGNSPSTDPFTPNNSTCRESGLASAEVPPSGSWRRDFLEYSLPVKRAW